jgi:hypothetical protein
MEILRFEDAGSPTPQRKKSSKGMLAVGLVATLFGISSAFASSTITINTTNTVDLAQGVVQVTGCDSKIGVQPVTELTKDETGTAIFAVTAVTIGYKYDTSTAGYIDTTECASKALKIQFYKDIAGTPTALTCSQLTGNVDALGSALALAGKVSVTQSGTSNATGFKCQNSAITFAVTHTQENINFIDPTLNPDAFDFITIESTQADVTSLA